MKTKYHFTLILAFIVINLWAQPPLPGDGNGDVADNPIHF